MSTAGQIVGAIGGAIIGFVVTGGNPVGAYYGFTIGYGVGSYVDPATVPGPKLGEAPAQTSRDGLPIPIIWGLHHTRGNIVQIGEIVEVTKKKKVSKKQKTTETRRYQTFAIGICAGPIHQVTRIWENERLVYDVRDTPAISADETAKLAEFITIYNGTDTQLPDADLEAEVGVGNQPAYRGLAYIVFANYDITEFGSAIPQYMFEVNGSNDRSVSSRPYPIELIEGVDPTVTPLDGFNWAPPIDGVDLTLTLASITLDSPFVAYSIPPEGIDPTVSILNVTLDSRLVQYTHETEGIDPTVAPVSITLDPRRVAYEYDTEGIDTTVSITGITLT